MTTALQATPRPWKVIKHTIAWSIQSEDWVGIAQQYCDSSLANAELIVRAVNNLDSLVALLEKTAQYLRCIGTNDQNDTCGVTFTCPNCIGRREIETTLKTVQGGR